MWDNSSFLTRIKMVKVDVRLTFSEISMVVPIPVENLMERRITQSVAKSLGRLFKIKATEDEVRW